MRSSFLTGTLLLLTTTALTGCPGPSPETCSDTTTTSGTGEPAWTVLRDEDDLSGVVLSVWGTGPAQVFVAGGPLGNSGNEALAQVFECGEWRDLKPGGSETFWWVSGSSATDVWFVGEDGRAAHYDGQSITDVPTGETATLWGVFSFGPTDVWAVGGTPDTGKAPNDIVLHYDGSAWTKETLPGEPRNVALFKVWGTSSDDLFVVGERGTIWHRTKDGWAFEGGEPTLAKNRLFTVNGCASDDVYAVGTQDVLHRDASGWSKLTIDLGNQVNGVACNAAGSAAIVGFGGLKQRLVDGQWVNEFDQEPYSDLHAVWADKQGAFWAVGGDFITPAKDGKRKGVIARYGVPF